MTPILSQIVSWILDLITGLSRVVVDFFVNYGGIVALVVGLISIYRFAIRRPNVRLVAEESNMAGRIQDGAYKSIVTFNVSNAGRKFANNVFLRINLQDWNFGQRQSGAFIRIKESTPGSDQTQTYGKKPRTTPDEDEVGINLSDSDIDVRNNRIGRLGGGEIYQLFVDDLIYNSGAFELFFAHVIFERGRIYELEYEIACQTYGPRRGTIKFRVGYNEMEVSHNHPRFWKVWYESYQSTRKRLIYKIREIASQITDRNLTPDSHITSSDIEVLKTENGKFVTASRTNSGAEIRGQFIYKGNYVRYFLPISTIKLHSRVKELRRIEATVTIWFKNGNEEPLPVGAVTLVAYGVEPGEVWKVRSPPTKTGAYSHLIDGDTEYPTSLNQLLPIPSMRVDGKRMNKTEDIEMEWKTEHYSISEREIVGIETEVNELPRTDQYEITATNTNQTSRSFFIVVKLYNENGEILSTPVRRFEIYGQDEEIRRVRLEGINSQETVAETDHIVISGI